MVHEWTLESVTGEMKAAQDENRQIRPFTSRLQGFDQAQAYEVARRIHEARVAAGALPIGRKIGFTNRNIWPVYGVYEPIWAHVYDTTVTRLTNSTGTCAVARFAEPRIEPEIVLHFKRAPAATRDPEEILSCIDWIAHGFEIVQTHFPEWKFKVADTIADSSLHGALFIGEPQNVEQLGRDLVSRLASFRVALMCDGVERDRGTGSNVLDSPLAAVAHLVGVLAEQPRSQALKAGELVTTGTLTQALPIHAGELWSTRIEGIELPGLSLAMI
jgi:2-keto-4-pentenoate hydratase